MSTASSDDEAMDAATFCGDSKLEDQNIVFDTQYYKDCTEENSGDDSEAMLKMEETYNNCCDKSKRTERKWCYKDST